METTSNIRTEVNFVEEINRLKKEKNAVLLAHYYQSPEIQDVADYIGDSLALSQQAAGTNADMIVFAGVKFMAETAKILSPTKKVVLPDIHAGCSLADSCTPDQFGKFLNQYPGYTVISYINCTAEVKAMSDLICTSSNALKIINSIPKNQPIVFAPDMNLGKYLIKESGREMVLWKGACTVHETFSIQKINILKEQHPDAKIIAHPECGYLVLEVADYIGSTTALLNYASRDSSNEFIVVTEAGIIHQMKKVCPYKTFIPAPPVYYTSCACGECPYMRLNTLEKIYLCMKDETPEITIPETLRQNALLPLERMLQFS